MFIAKNNDNLKIKLHISVFKFDYHCILFSIFYIYSCILINIIITASRLPDDAGEIEFGEPGTNG